jgi:hypothetical protein
LERVVPLFFGLTRRFFDSSGPDVPSPLPLLVADVFDFFSFAAGVGRAELGRADWF